MRQSSPFLIMLTIVIQAQSCAFAPSSRPELRRISQTKGFVSAGDFKFTISPNDRWMVFFKQVDDEAHPELHSSHGNLQILDLKAGELHTFGLREREAPDPVGAGDTSWAPDSSHCLLPPPIPGYGPQGRAVLINVRDAENPSVTPIWYEGGPKPSLKLPEGYILPERFTCSDCFPHTDDVELMKKHVDNKYLTGLNRAPYENREGYQIVSPDATKIYYQKGYEQADEVFQYEDVALYELDIASGKERKLVAYHSERPTIQHLRISPDGRLLAYQYSHGSGLLTSAAELHVLNLKTGANRLVATGVSGTVHWNSKSDKLYFYNKDYVNVAEFEQPTPAPTSRPSDKPAQKPAP